MVFELVSMHQLCSKPGINFEIMALFYHLKREWNIGTAAPLISLKKFPM